MAAKTTKDAKIIIRVTDEIKDEFQAFADSMGMTLSSLGAYCIGRFLTDERNKKEMHNKMLEMVSPQIMQEIQGVDFNDPRVAEAMAKSFGFIAEQQRK